MRKVISLFQCPFGNKYIKNKKLPITAVCGVLPESDGIVIHEECIHGVQTLYLQQLQ
ncbi:MAG: hypothetical protein PVF37_00425 [Desulfobacterales bacterium]